MRRLLILWGILAFASICLAATRTYEFLLPTAARAGGVTLAAGQYRLRVEGSLAVITNVRNAETYVLPVRVGNTVDHDLAGIEMKIAMKKHGGVEHIDTIELVDVNATLQF